MNEKLDHMKIYAFDRILEHLNKSGGDQRSREQRRVRVALRHINQWLTEGSHDYEKRQNKSKVEVEG